MCSPITRLSLCIEAVRLERHPEFTVGHCVPRVGKSGGISFLDDGADGGKKSIECTPR